MHEIRLKRLRKELNLSKEELIELFKSHNLEMSITHLNIYEQHGIGKEVNWPFWEKVAEVFDVDVAYLLNASIFRRQADVQQQLLDYQDRLDSVDEFCENQIRGMYGTRKNKSF